MAEPIVSVAEMRAREEASWAAGISVEAVIREAGLAVAAAARRLTEPGAPVLVLCGKGHNGDDAAIAGAALADRAVLCGRLVAPSAFAAARAWLAAHRHSPEALVIDGLFGIGLNRPLAGEWADLVSAIRASGVRVVSVDVPSGLDADTGVPLGPTVEAAVTVTFGAVKRGLVASSAARYVGRLELVADIGLLPGAEGGEVFWTTAGDFRNWPARRRDDGHKGTYGHVAVLGGSLGYHGAAVLAAEGALRARPGLVTVFTDERCYVPVASQLRVAMVRPWQGEQLEAGGFEAIVLGPGLASPSLPPAVRSEVRRLWASAPGAVIADASALDFLLPVEAIQGESVRVITPHPGEAARLLGTTSDDVQADRCGALRRLAGLWQGGTVIGVLKGRQTVVGGQTGPVFLNPTGNPGMAQGGTGDVLAGFLGGLLAQPSGRDDALRAVRYGVWRHGEVADALERRGGAWTSEDLAARLS